ncbi:DNA-directed RNA polymerase I subunit RPA1 [Pyricularia oryzae 70-15]|uniref:DNA-directed RNA polymerase subunit n=3 Tax=Pyricularia oryzae TaxID=318829 RepID=G4NBX7_PYRO7|nr:DNA-directed RNA polymerase I subunit RPA1 [Pyricularia oryzae 70-15]EHA48179.1 DNA-directed RNA polymerase I subunit RPA1 [Pyricularia oryzae 70-15]ELQ40777.1 DNA-directed RNA polymerase I subunit RPA1 [Pyricularia oryzae Y34]KAI7916995.1 DNA-directed RNA polymerase I subunit RPA1 [Pyricularia oryzae]KAI7926489.1 DNA-directed RNA polymerase I subunit RPA1 [Pyricularia oryzae]
MNISQPVSSSIDSVSFELLSADEIRAFSVRRIENDSTFDTLLNPVPGGLYDPALGAWGDSVCATCNLGPSACPGHPGHIELPVPVYHPVFMDQVLRLLRSQCAYCHRFRMRRRDINRYICLFRLLQYGLLAEAKRLDLIGDSLDGVSEGDTPKGGESETEDAQGGKTTEDVVIRKRNAYVRQVLQQHQISLGEIRKGKHEGASEMRRDLVKQFLQDMTKSRICASCDGVSPTYRKDRFVKIFEKPLSSKDQGKMAQGRFKLRDAMAIRQKPKTDEGYQSDEAVSDADLPSEESSGEESVDGDDLDEQGNVVKLPKSKPKKSGAAPSQRYLSAREVLERLDLLFEKEQEVLSLFYNSKPSHKSTKHINAGLFFVQTLLVPPNRFRPEARTGDSQINEAQQNSLYKAILKASTKLTQIFRDLQNPTSLLSQRHGKDTTILHEAWTELQDCVNTLIDNTKSPTQGAAAKALEEGIKQKLEKKEGLFRKNMMGKRVNYAARSVISPDPNIETNEIGVPPVFARKLTYPEPVTSHNFRDMQQAVINGPDKWPGAAAIENENGQIVNLRNKSQEERSSLANQLLAPTSNNSGNMRNKKVHRHISNGDVVLMNRQPTLHKPSIMGHRVRVLPGEKTIRMHYANCNTYNADFDGDEMNMHFPQNEVARTEALQLADTDHQYISGTQGKPLRGLIQDHLSVSVALCNKDTYLDRSAYHELVYNALRPESGHILRERIELVPPAIIKPKARWTGKQVITTVLRNIRPLDCGDLWMTGKTQVPAHAWGVHSEEGQVLFRDGEFISGILDKAQLGPSSGGLVHAVHEVYGPAIAGKLLSAMGRLLTRYLNMRAFTCGMDDLKLTPEGEADRRNIIDSRAHLVGLQVAAKYVSLDQHQPANDDPELLRRLEEVMRDDTKQEGLDGVMNSGSKHLSQDITTACLPKGLEKQFPKNQMQAMTISGAKGGQVNANLISCNLGQQVLEGRRVPLMVSGKSLPCFKPFETDIRAGGYIVNRFLTGIRPQEYYFHHMAGREGLIDTAVKTSRSGYLQRCLIKGMEGLEIGYDNSVRDADGSLVQFLYGEDGLDVTKQKYLKDFTFILHNIKSELAQLNISDPRTLPLFELRDEILKQNKSNLKKAKANPRFFTGEPVSSMLNPTRYAYATSEKFFDAMSSYVKENPDALIKEKDDKLRNSGPQSSSIVRLNRKAAEKVLSAKYMRSLVHPGEAVGIVAGQSVGEPSTQMTLNTFHLAGHSAKNVTLGIPRLRELLMTASSKISTPSMTLILNEEMSPADGEKFAKAISMLPLSHVVDKATVFERVGTSINHKLAKMFDVRLRFFPSAEYTKTYAITTSDVLNTVETKFMSTLRRLVAKEIKTKGSKESAATPVIGEKVGTVEMAAPASENGPRDEDDDSDEDEGDATADKQKANRSEAVSYGPNDDDDDVIQRQQEQEAEFEDEGLGGSPPPESSKNVTAGGDDDPHMHMELDDVAQAKAKDRELRVRDKNPECIRFRCDETSGEWCEITLEYDIGIPKILMLSLVQDAVRKALVQQIPGIKSGTFVAEEKVTDPWTGRESEVSLVHTAGSNLRAMQQYGSFINPNRISTNDVAAVLEIYGVEACRANIIRELRAVFESHAITVDNRHLNLIADHMTRSGGFTPFNRMGLSGNVSPFTKMSFETTLAFLKDAVLDGDWDDLSTPSGRLVMGRLGHVGTGAFDVFTQAPMSHFDAVAAS